MAGRTPGGAVPATTTSWWPLPRPGGCARSRSTPRTSSATRPAGSGCSPLTTARPASGPAGPVGSGSPGPPGPGSGGSGSPGGPALPDGSDVPADSWWEVLPETRVQPDTRHRFLTGSQRAATHVRLDVIPDGGLARLRVFGEIVPGALADLRQRWRAALPDAPGTAGADGAA